MPISEPEFTLGIEEEYLLVNLTTAEIENDPPDSFMKACQDLSGDQVAPEFLRSQVEIGTRVCHSMEEARTDLQRLRRLVIGVANEHDLAPIAASTHPFGHWSDQMPTERARYSNLASELQGAARRMLICGMHVHVGVSDNELRIDLMNQMQYFLPHLLALSSSSPFWEGQDTGLKSYRLTIFDALPRTGLPETFSSFAEYERHVQVLVSAGVLEDATKIWWDLRPSARYPTLETRVLDVCSDMEDTLCLAALTMCLMRFLYRLRLENQRWRVYSTNLLNENRWRAMRYGYDEGLIDLARGAIVPFPQLLEEILELVAEDAEALNCVAEVEHARTIVKRGTSSHHQVRIYNEALANGASEEEALREVVRFLVHATEHGISA